MGFGRHPDKISMIMAECEADATNHLKGSSGWFRAYRDAYARQNAKSWCFGLDKYIARLDELIRQKEIIESPFFVGTVGERDIHPPELPMKECHEIAAIMKPFGHAEIRFHVSGRDGEFWLVMFPGQKAYSRGKTLKEATESAAKKMAEMGLAPDNSVQLRHSND